MSLLSPAGRALVDETSKKSGFSPDAVTHVLVALDQGGGTQAQFNHFELGGMGQWSLGGMTMIGDMFNNGLKARVDALCTELSGALANAQVFQPTKPISQSSSHQSQSGGGSQSQFQGSGGFGSSSLFVPGAGQGNWWPEELGQAGSTGAQNNLKYAYFPASSRLAILLDGRVTVYDTGEHQIGGFGQQQSGDQSLTFTSQFGLVRVADLPIVRSGDDDKKPEPPAEDSTSATDEQSTPTEVAPEPDGPVAVAEDVPASDEPIAAAEEVPASDGPITATESSPRNSTTMDSTAIFETLEKLGDLRDKGILSETEFTEKKTELLARL